MIAALACLALLAADASADQAAYRSARDAAGRDPDAHVRLALWCERHDMAPERLKHLALAVIYDPAHAAARGLLGQVRDADGRWIKADDLADRAGTDAERAEALADYNARRDRAGEDDAEAQWDLALWCEQHGLEPEARAHLTAVVRLDPSRDAAWKRLGCRKFEGRWMSPGQIEAVQLELRRQAKADRAWRPRLADLRDRLRADAKRPEAEAKLREITDPRAVPSIVRTFALAGAADQAVAVQLLGQVDSIPASRALAHLAVFGGSDAVRQAATETLARRDTREVVAPLVALLQERVSYQVKPVGADGGASPGVLIVNGPKADEVTYFANDYTFDRSRFQRFFSEDMPFDTTGYVQSRMIYGSLPAFGPQATSLVLGAFTGGDPAAIPQRLAGLAASPGLPNRAQDLSPAEKMMTSSAVNSAMITAVQREREVANVLKDQAYRNALVNRQMAGQVAQLDRWNARVTVVNESSIRVLHALSGQDHGEDIEAWREMAADVQGITYRSPQEQPRRTIVRRSNTSCFAAGTPVRTAVGTRPIESLKVGDLVIARDVDTGALAVRPIVVVYHNPPTATLRVDTDRDAIVATPIHRFWVAGRGWVMARDLKPGDSIRTLAGLAEVRAVSDDATQPVFNLEVADDRNFLVGEAGLLVHDNSLTETVTAPFDAPTLATTAVAE